MPLVAGLFLLGLGPGCRDGAAGNSHPEEDAEVPTLDASSLPGADASPPGPICPSPLPVAAPEGAFLPMSQPLSGSRPRCAKVTHAFAGAAGSTLEIEVLDWGGFRPGVLVVRDLLGQKLASLAPVRPGAKLQLTLERSGEHLLELGPRIVTAPANSYRLFVRCIDGCDLEYSRYPIVLMHGMAGTDAYLDVVNYYNGVHDHLTTAGYLVASPGVDAFGSVAQRAGQWQGHLDDLEAQGLGRRFNFIAHSQGGLDARYLISRLGDDRPASLTMIATPNLGTEVADVVCGIIDPDSLAAGLADLVVGAVSGFLGLGSGEISAQVLDLTTPAMAAFNAVTLDSPQVAYYSWAGHSCGALQPICIAEQQGEVVFVLLGPTYTLLDFLVGPNDGMVPVRSAIWGEYLGELPADHVNEVGHSMPVFDHLEFYLGEARRLAFFGM
ncbi:MAG: hypothetical protein RBU30_17005 [Polyangia bacterium]|nr:hypothetical protein [Polyangia bacterium]